MIVVAWFQTFFPARSSSIKDSHVLSLSCFCQKKLWLPEAGSQRKLGSCIVMTVLSLPPSPSFALPPPFYTLPRCLWAFSCSPFLSLSLTLPPFLPLDFSSPGGPKAKVWVALASSLRAGGWGQQRGEGSEKVA